MIDYYEKKIQFNVFSSFLHPFLMVFAVKMCTLKCHHKLQDFSWQLHPSKINQHACSSRLHFFPLPLTHSLTRSLFYSALLLNVFHALIIPDERIFNVMNDNLWI
jgi:hypothetical protein